MSKHQLTQLLNTPQKSIPLDEQSWVKRYNDVIDVYNKYENRKTKLEKMECINTPYLIVSKILNNYLLNIVIVLGLIFVPVFNLVLEMLFISYFLFLKQETLKHQNNLEKVPDPFLDFYFYPEMCQQVKKHFTVLNLTVQEIENFTFNENHEVIRLNLLKHTQSKSNNKKSFITIPIYDQYFYDSFFLVKKELYKALSWTILGVVLMVISIIFYTALFEIQLNS